MNGTDNIQAIRRLEAVQISDAGLFVLAVHAFAEATIRRTIGATTEEYRDANFAYLVNEYRRYLIEQNAGVYHRDLDVLRHLSNTHHKTNPVRHEFESLDPEEIRIATQHLVSFCSLAGLPVEKELGRLKQALDVWNERKTLGELESENCALRQNYEKIRTDHLELLQKYDELSRHRDEKEHLLRALSRAEKTLADEEKSSSKKAERIEELRKERGKLKNELHEKNREIESLKEAEKKLEQFKELLVHAQTRMDYERMVVRLTAEQTAVLSQIALDKDFLIKGTAGTGKTLVLLKAIEKAKGRGTGKANAQNELGLQEISGSVALLTYTNTLVKYDQWLSALMLENLLDGDDTICTADSFIKIEADKIIPGLQLVFDQKQLEAAAAPFAENSGLSAKELVAEAEQFVWANAITETEYLQDMIPRTGRKTPLSLEKRKPVWAAIVAFGDSLLSSGTATRCQAANLVLEHSPEPVVDYLFIDEAQDLPAAVIRACKNLTRKAVILAGDADQSIYQNGFTFKRAGIDITGKTRILRSNFRNTVQVHALAERYRNSTGGDTETGASAWREGPEPAHIQAPNGTDLTDALARRARLYINDLGYEPHNLCILASTGKDIERIIETLGSFGLPCTDIRNREFNFGTRGSIRVSTLHSAKGLDFPIVLLYLNRLPGYSHNSEEPNTDQDRMTRNLIYVSLTRAMEHLDIFTLENPSAAPIADLVALVE